VENRRRARTRRLDLRPRQISGSRIANPCREEGGHLIVGGQECSQTRVTIQSSSRCGHTTSKIGAVARRARYLGPHLRYLASFSCERGLRIAAAEKAHREFGKFWQSAAPRKLTRLVFHSAVVGRVFSGVTAFVLGKADLQRLDTTILKCVRRLMRGAACIKTVVPGEEGVKHRSLPCSHLWQWIELEPASVELAVMRLRAMQNYVRNPVHHDHTFSAFVLPFAFESDKHCKPNGLPKHPWLGTAIAV
jgi:hypothetical protein